MLEEQCPPKQRGKHKPFPQLPQTETAYMLLDREPWGEEDRATVPRASPAGCLVETALASARILHEEVQPALLQGAPSRHLSTCLQVCTQTANCTAWSHRNTDRASVNTASWTSGHTWDKWQGPCPSLAHAEQLPTGADKHPTGL
jgi:hypothetical protein